MGQHLSKEDFEDFNKIGKNINYKAVVVLFCIMMIFIIKILLIKIEYTLV